MTMTSMWRQLYTLDLGTLLGLEKHSIKKSVLLFIGCGPRETESTQNAIHCDMHPMHGDKCFKWPANWQYVVDVTSCAGGCHNMPPTLQVDLLTLKVVSESRVMWPTSVPILVFLGFSVLDLGPMYVTDRQTSDRQTSHVHHHLMPPTLGAGT